MYIPINDLSVTFSIICMLSKANYIIISPRIHLPPIVFSSRWSCFHGIHFSHWKKKTIQLVKVWFLRFCGFRCAWLIGSYWWSKTISVVNFMRVRIRDSECDTQIKANYSWLLATHFIQTPQDIKEDQQEGCCMLKIIFPSALLKQHADVLW